MALVAHEAGAIDDVAREARRPRPAAVGVAQMNGARGRREHERVGPDSDGAVAHAGESVDAGREVPDVLLEERRQPHRAGGGAIGGVSGVDGVDGVDGVVNVVEGGDGG